MANQGQGPPPAAEIRGGAFQPPVVQQQNPNRARAVQLQNPVVENPEPNDQAIAGQDGFFHRIARFFSRSTRRPAPQPPQQPVVHYQGIQPPNLASVQYQPGHDQIANQGASSSTGYQRTSDPYSSASPRPR